MHTPTGVRRGRASRHGITTVRKTAADGHEAVSLITKETADWKTCYSFTDPNTETAGGGHKHESDLT